MNGVSRLHGVLDGGHFFIRRNGSVVHGGKDITGFQSLFLCIGTFVYRGDIESLRDLILIGQFLSYRRNDDTDGRPPVT